MWQVLATSLGRSSCISRNPLLFLLLEIKEINWAREHHRPLCFGVENLSISHYPEQHPQIGCRRLKKQEWRKAAGDETLSTWDRPGSGLCGAAVPPSPLPASQEQEQPRIPGDARGCGVMACSPTGCPALADRVAAGTIGSDYEYKKLPRQPQRGPLYAHHTLASKLFVEFPDFFLCFFFFPKKQMLKSCKVSKMLKVWAS